VGLLSRVGLAGPAFRAYERVVASRPRPVAVVDGPPLPPAHLMVRAAGTADTDWFLRSGRAAFDVIAAHVPLEQIGAVLDFGCGCGRVTRHWQAHGASVSGSDLNPEAIEWCSYNLPFASFLRNGLAPPLGVDDSTFDLVYALSVFTHFSPDLQIAWRNELRRVLRPGGYLLLTTHGRSYLHVLDADEREQFERGELVVRWGDHAGSNLCSSHHPEEYLRRLFADGFAFLVFAPEGARGNPTQDLVLLRKL
jgi:SAM-dependent methyltransferase